MTFYNRYPSHRRLRARQPGFPDFFPFDNSDTTTTPTETLSPPGVTSAQILGNNDDDGNNNTPGHGHGNGNPTTTTSTSDPTIFSPTPSLTSLTHHHEKPTKISTTEQPATTSTSTSSKETSITSTTSATISTTSSSSSSSPTITFTSTTSTPTTTSTSNKPIPTTPVIITAPAVTQTHTTGFVNPTTNDAVATASSTPSTAPSAGLSTGAIVGSVAGGIVGLVAIFFIVAFLLFKRRWRNRIRDEDFNREDFARTPNMTETGNGYNNNPFEPTPPNPAFRHHSIAPSIGSGPNMAGQGSYAYGNDTAYTDTTYAAGGAGGGYGTATGAAAYGTYQAHTNDDAINGAYSSEPRPQQAYDAEAYGSYAYSTDGAHAVTTGTQHVHPYSSTEYQAHYQENAPVRVPALVAGAPAVPANRAPSVYNVEDAYGGI
ncbi:hypothetical protein C0995_005302 [Termitomyces sp. Mi166|nr:hypothetical protein C0995_005302 [Termitomyces sp. Mi166\